MPGDMADFINDQSPDEEFCETCQGNGGECPDCNIETEYSPEAPDGQ